MEIIEQLNEAFRQRRQRIIDLRNAGMPVAKIAEQEGVTKARIYQIIDSAKRSEVVAKSTLPHPSDAQPVIVLHVREIDNG